MFLISPNRKIFELLFVTIIFFLTFNRLLHPLVIFLFLIQPKGQSYQIKSKRLFYVFFLYCTLVFIYQYFYLENLNISYAFRNIYYVLILYLSLRFFVNWQVFLIEANTLRNVFLYSLIIFSSLSLLRISFRMDFYNNIIGNFQIINSILLLYILIIINRLRKNKKLLYFILFALIIAQGYLIKSQQAFLLGFMCMLVFFIPIKIISKYISGLLLFIIFFPIIIVWFTNSFENFSIYDENIIFRYDAYNYYLNQMHENFFKLRNLDSVIHPYFIYDYDEYSRNISSHNYFIDSYAKFSIYGCILLIIIIVQNKPSIYHIINKPYLIYIWILVSIHLSINQIYTFKDIVLLSFLLSCFNFNTIKDNEN